MKFLLIVIIFLKSKTLRHTKHLIETISVITIFHYIEKFYNQITDYVNISKATIANILYWCIQN